VFNPPQSFSFGWYLTLVEIGTIAIRRLVAVDDLGVVVSPMLVEGQAHCSLAQGLGRRCSRRSAARPAGPVRQHAARLPTANRG
jgi:CO/xanthine dehydrogenase Mo-binding subunit